MTEKHAPGNSPNSESPDASSEVKTLSQKAAELALKVIITHILTYMRTETEKCKCTIFNWFCCHFTPFVVIQCLKNGSSKKC